jgi:hypothetical protein
MHVSSQPLIGVAGGGNSIVDDELVYVLGQSRTQRKTI